MNKENKKIEQVRKLLVQMALDDICSVDNFSDFYLNGNLLLNYLRFSNYREELNINSTTEFAHFNSEKLKQANIR